MKYKNKKAQIEILIVIIIFMVFFAIIFLICYDDEKSEEEICTKICERKGMEFIDKFGAEMECRCLTKEGDIEWFPRK